jgi:translation elongation factor aEF-1 beta
MAEVLMDIKVFPAEGANLKKVLLTLQKKVNVKRSKEEEIAFGLKALIVSIVVDEDTGGNVEETIKKLPGVGEIEVLRASRLL